MDFPSETTNLDEVVQFATDKPNIELLAGVYDRTKNDLNNFFQQTQQNFDVRHNIWAGKSDDYRKHARAGRDGQPFPWDGASDMPNYLADNFIRYHADMLMNSFRKSNLVATPTEGDDIERASVISSFLKWLVKTRMSEFANEVEIGIHNLLEKGIMAHYIYWERVEQKVIQTYQLSDLANEQPALAEAIVSGEFDDEAASVFVEFYNISKKKALKAVKDFRETGVAKIPTLDVQVNRPKIKALAPDEDILLPAYTMNPQDAEAIFVSCLFTPTQLREKVKSEGWNEEWVEYAIANLRGKHTDIEPSYHKERVRNNAINTDLEDDTTIRVTFAYQKLVDDDGDMGVYVTTFHPKFKGDGTIPDHAKYELLPYAHGMYPFIVTPLENFSKRLYETRSYPEIAEPYQQQLKIEIDSSIDRQSLATLPPMTYPMGRPPMAWGPGVRVGERTKGEYGFADVPPYDGGSIEIRQDILRFVNEYFGKNGDGVDPQEVAIKQQALVERFFSHMRQVIEQVFSLYQQYGSDVEYFRVTGVRDIQKFEKGDPRERYDFALSFDATAQDPALVIERIQAITQMANELDHSGRLDRELLLERAIGQIAPGWGEDVIMPEHTATQKIMEDERNALTQIAAGFTLDVPENDAHGIKLQIDQEWASQPDVSQRLMEDEAFAARFQDYVGKRQFQMQQQQNAQIGRLGGTPSQFGQAEI